MTQQIKPSVTNPTIADIYEKIDDGRLDLAPVFQRKFVWTQDHQEQFIDTILQGYPFPEIYVCKGDTDTIRLRTSQTVIDGQQRLTTIKNYIEGKFEKKLKRIVEFCSLPEEDRESFLSYQIVVRDIGKVHEGLIREIFRRINLTKFKLEDIEVHNAIYDGKFIQTAKEIANNIQLEKYGVFFESEFTRMVDIHFFLLVMSTIELGGYYNRDGELENFIVKYNEDYDNAKNMKLTLLSTFSKIDALKLGFDSIWFRKSNFFTLVIELTSAQSTPDNLKQKLEEFDAEVLKNRYDKGSDYGIYYGYMYAGTNNRKARITRSELFKKYILGEG